VQASYVLMDREATLAKAETLIREAAANGADLVALPEAFVPGTPIWIDTRPIWDGDAAWYSMLVEEAVVVPGPATERLGRAARDGGVYLVVGVNEREPDGATIYNSILYFAPDGSLLGKHRKLVPTGSERTVWAMGDGSTLRTYPTPFGRIGGLTCWENYMPLARFFVYSQGVDIWIAPTLAAGDFWIATLQYIAVESGCYVVGVNPCLRADQVPRDFPNRDTLWTPSEDGDSEWLEPGATMIVGPRAKILAGPVRREETIVYAEVDLAEVRAARRLFDPVGHYHRPDVFRLAVDTRPRPSVVELGAPFEDEAVQGATLT
jgi:predicted amidohydrolase